MSVCTPSIYQTKGVLGQGYFPKGYKLLPNLKCTAKTIEEKWKEKAIIINLETTAY